MDFITVITTREVKNESDGIGLGWLLALVIGGGVLLFTAIGLLLAWRIRAKGQQCTTRVYAMDDPTPTGEYEMQPNRIDSTRDSSYFGGLGSLTASSTTRLVKKRVAESGSSWSRMSSKTFLPGQVPPVLPPLPTYNSFLGRGIFGKGGEGGTEENNGSGSGNGNAAGGSGSGGERPRTRTRTRMGSITNWIDEEALHGPAIKRMSFRDSWFSKDAWMLRSPTLPSLVDAIVGPSQENKEAEQEQQAKESDSQPQTQQIHVQKRQDKINTSLTAPELSFQQSNDDRGRQRVIAQTQNPPMRPCATETDLRDILASTEQRLRDGTSRSPAKRITPSRSGRAGTPGRMTPSPSKRTVSGTPTPSPSKKTGLSRDASMSSIGSAANSLIKAATEELELEMSGAGSPRRRRGKEWEPLHPKPSQQQTEVEELAQRRRRSLSTDSDASSSLSTLYSVGESEDRDHQAEPPAATTTTTTTTPQRNVDDPFFNDLGGQGGRLQLMGPRPLMRSRTVNVSPRTMTDESAIPAPLRTISVNSRVGCAGVKDGLKNEPFRWSLLRQLPKPAMAPPSLPDDAVKPREKLVVSKRESLSAASSESSMVSVSVHTESTITDLPPRSRQESSPTPPPAQSSGAIDLSMLVMNVNSRPRNLPTPPPSRIFALRDSSSLTMTPLSPRPRSRHGPTPPPSAANSTQQLSLGTTVCSSGGLGAFPAHSRRASASSSVYDQDSISTTIFEDETAGSPPPPPPPPPPRAPASLGLKTVGSTVAELRRMNSTYSVASASSTYFR